MNFKIWMMNLEALQFVNQKRKDKRKIPQKMKSTSTTGIMIKLYIKNFKIIMVINDKKPQREQMDSLLNCQEISQRKQKDVEAFPRKTECHRKRE